MTTIDAFAGSYQRDRNTHKDVFVYNDQTFWGKFRRWWYRTFWNRAPW